MDALAALQRLGGGHFIEELASALIVTSEEVVTTGKPGTVTVTLKISQKPAGTPSVIVEEAIARTAPKKDAKGAFFYAVDGELHHNDPRQVQMEFRTVDKVTGEVIEVPASSTVVREA